MPAVTNVGVPVRKNVVVCSNSQGGTPQLLKGTKKKSEKCPHWWELERRWAKKKKCYNGGFKRLRQCCETSDNKNCLWGEEIVGEWRTTRGRTGGERRKPSALAGEMGGRIIKKLLNEGTQWGEKEK